jgi:hypothetical protein
VIFKNSFDTHPTLERTPNTRTTIGVRHDETLPTILN